MQAANFGGAQRICGAARIESGAPERFAGVDVADAGDARLIDERDFHGAIRAAENIREGFPGKTWRERVRAEGCDAGNFLRGPMPLDAAEMPRIDERESAAIELEENVHVNVRGRQLRGCVEPEELAVEAKVEDEAASGKREKQIFSATLDAEDFGVAGAAWE